MGLDIGPLSTEYVSGAMHVGSKFPKLCLASPNNQQIMVSDLGQQLEGLSVSKIASSFGYIIWLYKLVASFYRDEQLFTSLFTTQFPQAIAGRLVTVFCPRSLCISFV
jgi:hypothetical protein